MKRETQKRMQRGIIKISKNGIVSMDADIQMTPYEIADLFDVYLQTVNANIKAILKLGVVKVTFNKGAAQSGSILTADYYGLDMIITLAYRILFFKAAVFRNWLMTRLSAPAKSVQSKSVQSYILVFRTILFPIKSGCPKSKIKGTGNFLKHSPANVLMPCWSFSLQGQRRFWVLTRLQGQAASDFMGNLPLVSRQAYFP